MTPLSHFCRDAHSEMLDELKMVIADAWLDIGDCNDLEVPVSLCIYQHRGTFGWVIRSGDEIPLKDHVRYTATSNIRHDTLAIQLLEGLVTGVLELET